MSRRVLELIHARVSVESFAPGRPLADDEIRALVEHAIQAPSSFNLQHWRFVAVRGDGDRARLAEAAYGQRQVLDASVTFILLGDERAVERLPEILRRAVERGAIAEGKAAAWIRMATEIYADPRAAREEAIRSCAFAAMTLMLAAEARGLGATALAGFDPDRVRQAFGVPPRFVPALLLCVGHPASRGAARMPRLAVDEVLAFDRAREF